MEMRKILLTGSGITILAIIASFFLQPHAEIHVDDKGKSYISLSKKQAVLNYKAGDYFVLQQEKAESPSLVKVLGHPSDKVSFEVYFLDSINTINYSEGPINNAIFNARDRLNFPDTAIDTLHNLTFQERKFIFNRITPYEGRRYLSNEEARTDWFTKIDDSVFIFLLISLIPFLLMVVHDLILYFTKGKPNSKKSTFVQLFMLLLTLLFFFNMVTPESYSASKITALIKYVLLIFPIYFIYQHLIKGVLKDERAYKKAIILFAISILCTAASTFIARLIDLYIFKSDGYTMLAERPIYFELGLLFSFALGDFFNNLRKSYFQHRRRSKELDNTKEKMLASEAELNSIQASTNPHFLYNSLNAVASLAKTDPDKTEEMALALSKFYKYQTNRSGEPMTRLSDELEMIDNYLAIEKIRFGDRLQFRKEIDEDVKDRKIPHFLLQPLVENAIKYGYNNDSEKIDIKLSIKSVDKKLMIKLYDQGPPFTENLDSGFGLKSVMKKLQLFYPVGHSIDFVNTPVKHVLITLNEDRQKSNTD